jgi:hypothetical protein
LILTPAATDVDCIDKKHLICEELSSFLSFGMHVKSIGVYVSFFITIGRAFQRDGVDDDRA